MKTLIVVGVIAGLAGPAMADAERYKYDLKTIEKALQSTPPAKGIDKAPLGPPAWCPKLTEEPYGGGFESHLSSYYGNARNKDYELEGAAEKLCKNDPKEPIIQRAAQEVLQLWMNAYGLSSADAVESIKAATFDKQATQKAKEQLCSALAISDEVGGAEKAFMIARRNLFDCGSNFDFQKLVPWLDSSAKEPDELVRLAYVNAAARLTSMARTPDEELVELPNYVVAQYDFKALAPDKALAMLDKEPYKGNVYARVTVKTRLGAAKLGLITIEDRVKSHTDKDADWKELFITAPQRGVDAWNAAASKYKAELQRSAEFEALAFGPSRKAIKGCLPPLEKDIVALLKSMKHDDATELLSQINDNPVAGLLLRRYIACKAYDGNTGAAQAMSKLKLRVVRGPRAAAYWAAQDALAKITQDREKFPVKANSILVDYQDHLVALTNDLVTASKRGDPIAFSLDEDRGVVKTVTKDKDKIKVKFVVDKQQIWKQTGCKEGPRIVMWATDGSPVYEMHCTGKVVTADVSPADIEIANDLTANITPGKLIVIGANDIHERDAMAFEVYADKKGKKLVAWMGLSLQ